MLTSESGISRTTHVIEDYQTKKLRLLTPRNVKELMVSLMIGLILV